MRRSWILLLVFSMALNIGLLANRLAGPADEERSGSWRERGGPRDRGEAAPDSLVARLLARMTERLELDDRQRERIGDILGRHVPRFVEQRKEVAEARAALFDQLTATPVDAEKVRELSARVTARQATLDSLVAESLLEQVSVLDPEQRERFEPRGFGRHRSRGRRGSERESRDGESETAP